MLCGDLLEEVSQIKHLGSILTSDCTLDIKIKHRVAAANSAFKQLRQANIWTSRAFDLVLQNAFISMYCDVSSFACTRRGLFGTKHHLFGCVSDELPATRLWHFPAGPCAKR